MRDEARLFESEFLTPSQESKTLYQSLVSQAAQIVCAALPEAPYHGRNATALAELITTCLLPDVPASSEQIAATLRTVVSNSINVSHPRTAAHLHCPPLFAALAAEVVISALNQSMDSFDQAPIATVIEQKTSSMAVRRSRPSADLRRNLHHRWIPIQLHGPASRTGRSSPKALELVCAKLGTSSGSPPPARFCSEVAHFTVEKPLHN